MNKWGLTALIVGPIMAIAIAAFVILRPPVPKVAEVDLPMRQPPHKTNPSAARPQPVPVVNQPSPPRPLPVPVVTQPPQPRSQPEIVQPPPSPKPAIAKGKIFGAAWVNRKSGESIILRGNSVYILRDSIAMASLVPAMQDRIAGWNGEALKWYELAKRWMENIQYLKSLPKEAADAEKHASDCVDSAKKCEATAAQLSAWCKNPQPRIADTLEAFRFLSKSSSSHYDFPVMPEMIVLSAKTGVDGKYLIADIPAGNYYVYCVFSNNQSNVEWMIPVTVNAGSNGQIDLFNENAETIDNHD